MRICQGEASPDSSSNAATALPAVATSAARPSIPSLAASATHVTGISALATRGPATLDPLTANVVSSPSIPAGASGRAITAEGAAHG